MDELWQKLAAFEFDSEVVTLAFRDRLARENGWPTAFADKVVGEYKRFVYLVASSGSELTPSEHVDQAWHLHMLYTRSYWQQLCGDILGFALHHHPTLGGRSEQQKFRRQYRFTLDSYTKTFGCPPPKDVWPDTDKRFQDVEQFIRINKSRCWIVPKPDKTVSAWLLSAIIFLPVLVACSDKSQAIGFWFWIKIIIALPGIYLLIKFVRWVGSGGGGGGGMGGGCGSGCSGCGGCGG